MSLIDRRNAAATALLTLTATAETIVTREGFDPDSAQWTDLQSELDVKRAEVERYDALLDTANRATSREVPRQPGDDWATEMLRAVASGGQARAAEVPIDRAYAVISSTEKALYAGVSDIRDAAADVVYRTPTIDAATTVSVSTNDYRYIVMPPPGLAAVVAEAGAKPGAEFVSTEIKGSLEKIAHILDVTQETLEDMPTARQILSAWLVAGVNRKAEALAAAAVTGAAGTLTAASDTVLKGIRVAVGTLAGAGLDANAVMLNPADWADLDLDIFGQAGSNSQAVSQSNPFGVRLISNPAVAAGTLFVGDFKAALLHIQRSTVSVDITDSGMSLETVPRDRFTHNLYGFRAEARAKTIIQQPKALVKVTVTPVTP